MYKAIDENKEILLETLFFNLFKGVKIKEKFKKILISLSNKFIKLLPKNEDKTIIKIFKNLYIIFILTLLFFLFKKIIMSIIYFLIYMIFYSNQK